MENEFKYAVEDLIDLLSNETCHTEVPYSITRKISFKAFEDAQDELNDFLSHVRRNYQNELQHFKEEIANELAAKFSDRYWYKFEDGHDIEEGQTMICYLKSNNKYSIGTAVSSGCGISFKIEDGSIIDPDYVAILPKVTPQ